MKQSDIGPMGVASLLVVLLLEVASLGVAPPGTWPLLMALGMAAGRVVPLAATLPGRGEEPVPGTLSSLVAGKVGKVGLWASRGAVLLSGGAVTWWLLGWPAAAPQPSRPAAAPSTAPNQGKARSPSGKSRSAQSCLRTGSQVYMATALWRARSGRIRPP